MIRGAGACSGNSSRLAYTVELSEYAIGVNLGGTDLQVAAVRFFT
jgi:hypothetical protein